MKIRLMNLISLFFYQRTKYYKFIYIKNTQKYETSQFLI